MSATVYSLDAMGPITEEAVPEKELPHPACEAYA